MIAEYNIFNIFIYFYLFKINYSTTCVVYLDLEFIFKIPIFLCCFYSYLLCNQTVSFKPHACVLYHN